MKHKVPLLVAVMLAACGQPPNRGVDAVFLNAAVWTVNDAAPMAEAVAINGDEIVYVGDNAGALELAGDNTVRHDLTGRMLLPGFIDVHIHALGERAVHEALDAIEVARAAQPDSTTRYTLCHIQVISDQDLPRFARLGVIAQSTPLWASYDTYGQQFVSDDQFQRFWRFRSLHDLGVRLTWGSDFPASGAGLLGMSPVLQMEIGHTRQNPGEADAPIQPRESERLDLETLIQGYTINAAYQLHMEDEIGSIEVGKKADLVVLDRNLFEIDPYQIHETKVLMTLLGGEIVYEAGD